MGALVAVYPKPVRCSLKEEINTFLRRVLSGLHPSLTLHFTYNFLPTYSLEIATLSFHCLLATHCLLSPPLFSLGKRALSAS